MDNVRRLLHVIDGGKGVCTLGERRVYFPFRTYVLNIMYHVLPFFKNLQSRPTLKASGVPLQSPLALHPLLKVLCSTRGTSGLVDRLYWFLS